MKRVEDTKQGAMQELDRKKEIGRFSMEWSEKTFDELFDFLSTGTNSRSDLSLYGDVGYIHYGDIHSKWNKFLDCDKEELPKISKQKVKNLPFLKEGDLILADASEDYVGIGACILLKNVKTRKIVSGLHTILLRSHNAKLSPVYSAYLTSIRDVKDKLISITTGISVYGLSKNQLKKIKVYLPSDIKEQTTIAQILSDTDDLIQQIDYLITKKKNIKQGAMQELLTGKRRLDGFTKKWEVKALENITNCLDNLRIPLNDSQRQKMRGDYPYCGANDVLDYVNDYVINDEFILIAEDGGHFDEYEFRPIAYKMNGKCWVNNHAHILKAKEGFSQDFIFYSLVHKNILRFLAGGTRAKLNKSEMYKIEIDIPTDLIEQTTIAQTLLDIEVEIKELEFQRNKYNMIKEGMMQKLLTGEIRLV